MNSHSTHGTAGQDAAESTKSAFKKTGEATEAVRQNINAYADTMISGHSKVDHNSEYHTQHIKEGESTGIHPDAKKAGDEIAKGAGAVAGKVEGFMEKHKHTNKEHGSGV